MIVDAAIINTLLSYLEAGCYSAIFIAKHEKVITSDARTRRAVIP